MSEMTNHQRPGVYSSYEASSLTAALSGGKAVAVVAAASEDLDGKPCCWTSYSRALAEAGDCTLTKLAGIAMKNGAGKVWGIPAGEDYNAAIKAVAGLEDVAVVVCDSTELSIQQALRDMAEECSGLRKERIIVAACAVDESVDQLVARAANLNSERVVLVAPGAHQANGITCAAAVAGAIAGNADPALPLGGVELAGIEGLAAAYEDGDIDLLVQGGITPLEMMSGKACVVRAVTTRTTTGGVDDATWRELSTILIVDEVIPNLRKALRAKFARAKNNEQTRGAIRSQVVLELETCKGREIIDGYGNVTVNPAETDPAVCVVEFDFAVTHGLNQIWLSAHITV